MNKQIIKGGYKGPRKNFTQREIDVLLLLSQGLSTDEIAERTGVSLTAIKANLTNIRKKTDAKNTLQAVAVAIRWEVI